MIQLSPCAHLEDNVNVFFIIEITIHFDDIGMIEKYLNFEFSDELLSNLLLQNKFFLDYFECTYELWAFLPTYHDNYLTR